MRSRSPTGPLSGGRASAHEARLEDEGKEAISFTTAPTIEGEEVHPGVILHFDATGRIVAIDVLHVSKTLAEDAVSLLRQAAE
ncbi:MAG TPA: DUF2283 domain-containing protein [Stellaceae bacterium]|nr:DUF2283 domain-containing protein [Stellaceae bacterium]